MKLQTFYLVSSFERVEETEEVCGVKDADSGEVPRSIINFQQVNGGFLTYDRYLNKGFCEQSHLDLHCL